MSPAGQKELFAQVGVPLMNRTAASPKLDAAGQATFIKKALQLAPKYRPNFLNTSNAPVIVIVPARGEPGRSPGH
jgi:hypothetical protein